MLYSLRQGEKCFHCMLTTNYCAVKVFTHAAYSNCIHVYMHILFVYNVRVFA